MKFQSIVLLVAITLTISMTSCTDYSYMGLVKVEYTNGDCDTINFNTLTSSNPEMQLRPIGDNMCLVVRSTLDEFDFIACEIRSFEILEEYKFALN